MGSVQSYETCPRCGGPNCFSDYYYKSGEEYLQCQDCGYYKSVEIKEESRKKMFSEMTEDDWVVTEISEPYGSFYGREMKSGVGIGGTISNEEHYKRILHNLEKDTYEELIVSRYVNGNIIVTDLMRIMKLRKLIKNIQK